MCPLWKRVISIIIFYPFSSWPPTISQRQPPQFDNKRRNYAIQLLARETDRDRDNRRDLLTSAGRSPATLTHLPTTDDDHDDIVKQFLVLLLLLGAYDDGIWSKSCETSASARYPLVQGNNNSHCLLFYIHHPRRHHHHY